MDIAYDHVQEESYSPSGISANQEGNGENSAGINTEIAQAFQAVSNSPWGSRLGGWLSQARKQGESFYSDLQKEASDAQKQAARGFTSLREQVVQRTRGMSLDGTPGPQASVPGEEGVPQPIDSKDKQKGSPPASAERPESLPADIIKEAGTLVNSLRTTAAARLKELQAAEDAADEALLKFGSNVRDFFRNAVIISAPPGTQEHTETELLFETAEPGTGRKVFHSTRLDAQLHAIHNSAASFTTDPEGAKWDEWKEQFDAEKQTESISADLAKYDELRRAMEKLVPEKVEYKLFWTRYYFLRKAIDEEEKRRKEVLKGAATVPDEEIAWDDDEEDETSTPNDNRPNNNSTTTLNAQTNKPSATSHAASSDHLKPSRRSHEEESKSVADSDASYDLVSGTTTRGPSSPKETKKDDESDDDWE